MEYLCSFGLIRSSKKEIESIYADIRGFVALSRSDKATLSISFADRTKQYTFNADDQEKYPYLKDFFKKITTPINWSVLDGETQIFRISVTLIIERKNTQNIDQMLIIDSFDIVANFEDRT